MFILTYKISDRNVLFSFSAIFLIICRLTYIDCFMNSLSLFYLTVQLWILPKLSIFNLFSFLILCSVLVCYCTVLDPINIANFRHHPSSYLNSCQNLLGLNFPNHMLLSRSIMAVKCSIIYACYMHTYINTFDTYSTGPIYKLTLNL